LQVSFSLTYRGLLIASLILCWQWQSHGWILMPFLSDFVLEEGNTVSDSRAWQAEDGEGCCYFWFVLK